MITFKFKKALDGKISLLDLTDLVGDSRKQYKNTMLGPYDDITLEAKGIIIDGEKEKELAEDFEKIIKRKVGEDRYERIDQFGILFYTESTF